MIRVMFVMFIVCLPVFITLHFLGTNAEPMRQGIKCLVDVSQCKGGKQ